MKCDKCGFIYNKKVDVCPYCGNAVQKTMSFFDKYIPLSSYSRMSVRSMIYILCVNIFLLGVILDLIYGFYSGYHFTIYGYCIGLGLITLIGIITRPKGFMNTYEKLNLFLIGLLILYIVLLPENIIYFIYYVAPIFFTASTIIMVTFSIIERKSLHPIKTISDGFLNWLLSLAVLIFLLINLTFGSGTPIPEPAKIFVYISFIITSLFLFNSTLFIAARVISETRRPYGK